jgi:flavin reductase (DIM6/NTAB) family NADH-FMN oxidoreductase RutF
LELPRRFESVSPTDQRVFRRALGHFCSGVTIITAADGESPVGMTCQSFFSVSLEPPLVAFSVARSSSTFPVIRRIGSCCVNVLAQDQQHLSDAFGRSGPDKTLGVQWARYRGAFGHPVIAGSLAAFECEIVAEYPAGDHHIILGRVQRLHLNATAYPLLYFRGRYQQLDDSGPDSEAHVGERGAVVDAAEQSVLPT